MINEVIIEGRLKKIVAVDYKDGMPSACTLEMQWYKDIFTVYYEGEFIDSVLEMKEGTEISVGGCLKKKGGIVIFAIDSDLPGVMLREKPKKKLAWPSEEEIKEQRRKREEFNRKIKGYSGV